ncbi:MAG: membrane protein FxsA [Hyphomicrobiales bacterium]|nr:MAG: membrane protein FxsA [Hyphomicrobiales bacterium]
MRFSLIPFMLLIVPLLEIAAFVIIGGELGVALTLALVVVTAVIGSFLLRWQGLSLITRIRAEMSAERMPAKELVRGVMIVIAGILLLTPGFVTDTVGFLLFVPPIQNAVWSAVKARVQIAGFGPNQGQRQQSYANYNTQGTGPAQGDSVVDLDPDEFTRSDTSSPWRDTESDGDNNPRRSIRN